MANSSRNTAIARLPGLAQFMDTSARYLLDKTRLVQGTSDLLVMSVSRDCCTKGRTQAGEGS